MTGSKQVHDYSYHKRMSPRYHHKRGSQLKGVQSLASNHCYSKLLLACPKPEITITIPITKQLDSLPVSLS